MKRCGEGDLMLVFTPHAPWLIQRTAHSDKTSEAFSKYFDAISLFI